MKIQFAKMMQDYFTNRKNLKGVFMLVDLRHLPTKDDIRMYQFLKYYNIAVVIIGTKLDKLKKNQYLKNEQQIKQALGFDPKDSFVKVSNLDKTNISECYDKIIKLLEG
ncbi:GTPase EngB [Mycoplasma putrefaciens]|nr:GTPase EngB [Mycoplasma putrefaciens]